MTGLGIREIIQKQLFGDYLKECDDFIIDKDIDNKILISVAPDGYLKRVK